MNMRGGRNDVESLRETLIDLEMLRQHEARARADSEMLLQGLRSLGYSETPEAMFAELFDQLRRLIGCDDVFVLRAQENGRLDARHATARQFGSQPWLYRRLFQRVTQGRVVAAYDINRIPEWADQPEAVRQNVVSALHGPVTSAGQPGLLVATSGQRGYFTPDHVEIMQRMLLLVEQALFHAEARETLSRERALMLHRDQLQQMVDAQTADLIEARRAAVDANASKGQLVASLGHELRSPLHAIIAFSDLAQRKGTISNDDAQRYFDRIKISGETILSLVDQLLDLAKMEAGRMSFSFEPVDVRGLVNDVIDEFESLASQQAVSLQAELEPVDGVVDAERIKQVVRNLLSNALKFSPRDDALKVRLVSGGGQITLSIEDNGSGVADADKQRVFDGFVQTESGISKPGGTGLGLAICREIIQAHRGRIWVEDADGGGSRFLFKVPLSQSGPALTRVRIESGVSATS
jgi:signal transduction histidine kinase